MKALKTIVATSILLLGVQSLIAKDIYVDQTIGNDANPGTPDNPYKTLQSAIDHATTDWDNVYVSPGTYRETVSISNKSKIHVLQKPQTSGHVIISGANVYLSDNWTAVDGKAGQFRIPLDATAVETSYTQLFCDGKLQQIARYPDNTTGEMLHPTSRASGYAAIYDAIKPLGYVASLKFDDQSDVLPRDISDEFVVRGLIGKLRNNIFHAGSLGDKIQRTGDYQIELSSNREDNVWSKSAAYEGKEGFGYLLDYSVLDRAGEWFYRKNEGYLYYQPQGGTLADKEIEVKLREYALDIQNSSDIEFTGINVKAAAVMMKSSTAINFTSCSFQYMRPYEVFTGYGNPLNSGGLTYDDTSSSTLEGCYIAHTWTSGVVIKSGSNDNIINNCVIEDMGWIGLFTSSVYLSGGSTTVTHNTFGRASRFHIRITSRQKTIIMDNEFYGALAMGEDTGVIHVPGFTSSDPDFRASIIAYNVIHDVYPMAAFDTQPAYKAAKVAAFYMEEIGNYAMHHNVVYNIGTEEQQTSAMGNYTAKVEGKIFFFPTQARDMSSGLDVKFYNNTCWNYNLLFTSWMEYKNGAYGRYEVDWKNNLLMANALSGGSEAQISLKRTGDIPKEQYYYDTLEPLVAELNKAPWSSLCSESNNRYLQSREAYNYKSETNFEPKIPYNEGVYLPGYTQDDGAIELGAYEGSTDEERTRVGRAGASIDPSIFPDYENATNIAESPLAPQAVKVYPNPAQDVLNIELLDQEQDLNVGIYSLNGQFQKGGPILASGFDISDLKQGLYILHINEINYQQLFIKQ